MPLMSKKERTPTPADQYLVPWLPPGHTLVVPGRGELFYRHHHHRDPTAPTVLLLHGWTASADLQFFTAYEALAEHFSFIGIDHRGHGRGIRAPVPFTLEDVADDAAALVEQLGVGPVVVVGYSMGGPLAMLLTQRHPHLVRGLVVQATALEWRAAWWERLQWKTIHVMGPVLRSWVYPRGLRIAIRKVLGAGSSLLPYASWLSGEVRRNDTFTIVAAGQALSRYDARPWATELHVPAASLITTKDRLVKPRKQRALAEALQAHVVELAADHLSAWEQPEAFAAATVQLVQHVTR